MQLGETKQIQRSGLGLRVCASVWSDFFRIALQLSRCFVLLAKGEMGDER